MRADALTPPDRVRCPWSRTSEWSMKPIQSVVETSIYADDLDRAERFYRDALGLTVQAGEAGRHVFFRVGDGDMLLVFRAESTLKGDHLPAHGARGPVHLAM